MHSTNWKHLKILLTPSWLSGLSAVTVWLAVVIGGLASTHFSGSLFQKGLFHLGERSGTTYQQLTASVSDNRLISNLPLIVFWLGIGLIVYYLAVGLYNAFHEIVELHEELEYVHVRRRLLLRSVAEQFAIRAVAVGLNFVYLAFFFKKLLPWALTGLRQVSLSATSSNILHALWVSLVLLLGLHLITVLLRLLFLRERLFSSAVYDV